MSTAERGYALDALLLALKRHDQAQEARFVWIAVQAAQSVHGSAPSKVAALELKALAVEADAARVDLATAIARLR